MTYTITTENHDFWEIMDQPIAALRERFGVPAVE